MDEETLLIAREVAHTAEARGFKNTAAAMRTVIEQFLKPAEGNGQNASDRHSKI